VGHSATRPHWRCRPQSTKGVCIGVVGDRVRREVMRALVLVVSGLPEREKREDTRTWPAREWEHHSLADWIFSVVVRPTRSRSHRCRCRLRRCCVLWWWLLLLAPLSSSVKARNVTKVTTYLSRGFAPLENREPQRCSRFSCGCQIGTPYPPPRHLYPGHRGLAQTRALPYIPPHALP
jgi:hypothetical protein